MGHISSAAATRASASNNGPTGEKRKRAQITAAWERCRKGSLPCTTRTYRTAIALPGLIVLWRPVLMRTLPQVRIEMHLSNHDKH